MKRGPIKDSEYTKYPGQCGSCEMAKYRVKSGGGYSELIFCPYKAKTIEVSRKRCEFYKERND